LQPVLSRNRKPRKIMKRKTMSNNISRKGLAFGALVAVAASLFAGAPAHAAAGVTLAPTAGDSYVGVVGATFSLTSTASSEIPSSSYSTVSVKVANTDGSTARVTLGSNAVSTASADVRSTDASVVVYDSSISANNKTITLQSTGSTTAHFAVTSWLDANGNHAVDAGELAATQTVTFLGAADLAAVTTLTAPAITTDSSALSAKVVISGVNTNYVGTPAVSVDFRVGTYDVRNVDWTSLAGHDATTAAQSVDTRTVFNASASLDARAATKILTAGAVITAQAYLGAAKLGAVASATVASAAVTSIASAAVVGDNLLASNTFRKNSAFQVKLTATGDARGISGKTIKVGVTSLFTAADGRSITVNGTTYTKSADVHAATINVVTDANGVAYVNIATAGWNGDDIVLAPSADNATGSLTLTQATIAYTAAASVTTGAVVKGGTFQVGVTLKDQFGVAAPAGYNAQAQIVGGSTTTGGTDASNTYAPIVGGAATLNIVENGTTTGNVRYAIKYSQVDAINGGYIGSPVAVDNVDLKVRAAVELVAKTVTVATTSARNLAATDLTVANGGSVTNWHTINGVVSASDDVRPYATVTVSGAGLLFKSGSTYALGSITVTSDAVGAYSVQAASNTTGTSAVTVTSGAATVSSNVVFNAPLAAAGASIVIAAPTAAVLVGENALVTFSVRDVYGNQLTAPLSLDVRGSDATYNNSAVDAKGFLNTVVTKAAASTVDYVVGYYNGTKTITTSVRVVWAPAVVTVSVPDTTVAGQNTDVVITVTDPAGNAIAGKTVTVTSTGVGYLTVASDVTDNNGMATVKLYANENELGWAYVTASTTVNTVSAVSAAAGFQVVAPDVIPTATDSVATLTLAVPASAQAGTVVDVVATATDADGNPVAGADVSATSTGVGYLAIAKGTTDDNGQLVLKLVVGAGENGTASVTATSGSAVADAAELTAGVTDANVTLAKKRVTVDWAFAANKKVVIVRDGVAIKSFVASSNAAGSFSFNLKKGTHKVSVKVGGVTIDSQSYKIK
jgi:trimeric autotransporter adhesin